VSCASDAKASHLVPGLDNLSAFENRPVSAPVSLDTMERDWFPLLVYFRPERTTLAMVHR
jgi:hypothetical protein